LVRDSEAPEKQLDDSSRPSTYTSVLAAWKGIDDARVGQFEVLRKKEQAWAELRWLP